MTIFEFNPHRCKQTDSVVSIHTKTTCHYRMFHLFRATVEIL
nr:MAG TPA: hypothetical protein [Crassvirales sp.]